jgi:putative membrane protein
MTFNWSKNSFFYGGFYGLGLCILVDLIDMHIAIPWGPIGVIGIAVAFYLGFKNNSAYDRTWEARKIWGSIVNNSRTFAAAVIAFTQGENDKNIQKELIYRHLAWLTALRHQLRLSKEWEHIENRLNGLYTPTVCEDYNNKLESELILFISQDEINSIAEKSNKATQILKTQSKRLQELKDKEYFDNFRHVELHELIGTFYTDQGKSERIKNFPFPRQYASVAIWMTFIFVVLIPFGLMDILKEQEDWMFWLTPFLTALITWVFFLMEKIGDYSENPFEGTYNDVPITSISRTIEIDLREMIDDTNIREPLESENGFLM